MYIYNYQSLQSDGLPVLIETSETFLEKFGNWDAMPGVKEEVDKHGMWDSTQDERYLTAPYKYQILIYKTGSWDLIW